MRKILTFLCAALMSASMFALTPRSGDTWDDDSKTLTVNSDLGTNAYANKDEIEHVIINNGVTSIGESAFYKCSNLETVTNYATTPQNIESKDVFADVTLSGCTLSVPAESVIEYSTASVWQDFGTIAAIPEPASAWVLRDGDEWNDDTKTLTVKSNLPYNAYKHQTVIKHVIISSGVTSIGYSAFVGCEGLKSVTIPSSVASIGQDAFCGCINLTSVTIPNSVASIAFGVFSFCIGLTSVTIPEGVTSIEEGAFYECRSLTSIEIPNSVKSIDKWAFIYCSKLASVTINATTPPTLGDSPFKHTAEGLKIYVPAGSVNAYKDAWSAYAEKIEAIVFEGVEIGDLYYNLKNDNKTAEVTSNPSKYSGGITIPTTVTYNAQNYSVTSIGYEAFSVCTSLTSITIPTSVTSIGDRAFYNCTSLTSIEIPNSVISIGESAFAYCTGLTSVTIGNGVISIGDEAFNGCRGLTSITIPNSVTSIGDYTFAYCRDLSSIVVASENTTYDSRESCNAIIETSSNKLIVGCKNTIIPNGVTSIGVGAFAYCTYLTSIEIPNSVTSIGNLAFSGCSGLTSITIPNSVTSIGNLAFRFCSNLASFTINATTPPTLGTDAFAGTAEGLKIYVPAGSVDTYKGAENWSAYADKITAIVVNPVQIDGLYYNLDADNQTAEVTSMPSGKYTGDIIIPESVEYYSVTYDVTSIGSSAFQDCTSLTSVTIPNSVTSIGEGAFSGCSGLTSVTINAESLESYGSGAFDGTAEGLKIYVPAASVETYKEAWTAYAAKIVAKWVRDGDAWDEGTKTLTVNSDLPENAYKDQTVIEHVIISSGVTSVGNAAFYECSGLTSVKCVRETPASLGNDVFYGTAAALKIYVPAGSVDTYKAAENWSAYADKIKAIQPAWVRDGDEWDEATKTLTVNSNPVDYAYQSQNVIQHVIINNGVTSVGIAAFNSCNGLTSVTIPNSVTSIGEWAFTYSNNLMSITCVRETPASLGTNAFPHRNEGVIYVPAGSVKTYKDAWSYYAGIIKAIPPAWVRDGDEWDEDTKTLTVKSDLPENAYKDQTVIEHVIINNGVTSIGNSAFFGCTALTSIVVASGNTTYDSRENCNAIIETATNTLILGCKNTIIPNSVTSIDGRAFKGCSGLTSVTIPNSVTSIGDYAFQDCSGLTSVRCVRETPASLGNDVFYGTAEDLKIYVPAGSVDTYKAAWTAYADKITPAWVRDGDEWDEGTKTLTVNSNLPINAYKDQNVIQHVIISSGVTSIGGGAFYLCTGLTSVTIPNSVTSIGFYAFYGCTSLTSITIPNSVTSIGSQAFLYCDNLVTVTVNATTPPTLGDSPFPLTGDGYRIYVPAGSVNAYKAAWTAYAAKIVAIPAPEPENSCGDGLTWELNAGVLTISYDGVGTGVMYDYDDESNYAPWILSGESESITSVIISNGVTSIGQMAFLYCTGLTSVTIPNSVTSIGVGAFAYCTDLTSITIPNSVTSIGIYAFVACSGLETVTINAESLESYGTNAFQGTAAALKIYVPAGSVNTYKAGWAAYADKIVAIPAPTPTAVENVQTNEVQATKFFRDGMLLIEKNGKTYNATGAEVK